MITSDLVFLASLTVIHANQIEHVKLASTMVGPFSEAAHVFQVVLKSREMIYQHQNASNATPTIIIYSKSVYVSILLVALFLEWLITKLYAFHVMFYCLLSLFLSIVYAYVEMDTHSIRLKIDVIRFVEME